jgi:hypothetical protein
MGHCGLARLPDCWHPAAMSRRSPGLIFLAVCLAALAWRIMLPVGWMPVRGMDGPVLSLCSGSSLPLDPASPPGAPDQPCGFALALGPALAVAMLFLPLLLLFSMPPATPLPIVAHRRAHRPRPPGQGPPLP